MAVDTEHPVDRKKVVQAIKTVKTLHSQKLEKSKTKSLLVEEKDIPVYMQITMHKIPYNQGRNVQMVKIHLPHSLMTDTTEVCLFTGDLDKRDKKAEVEPTELHYKELLSKFDIKGISEVISLRQLRTDYKPHEAKRQLVSGYDVFLADKKIFQCLPKVLGRAFFKKHKLPQQIDLSKDNLKDQVQKALSSTVLFLTARGNCCSVQIACLGFTTKQIANNIMSTIDTLKEKLPGGWCNVLSVHIKTGNSMAIPVYVSFESGNDVQLPILETKEEVDPEEITTLQKTKVKVFNSGYVEVVPGEEDESGDDSDFERNLLVQEQRSKDNDGFPRRKRQKRKKKLSVTTSKKLKVLK